MTTFSGGSSNDSFFGTANDDYMQGYGGDDTLIGGDGTDGSGYLVTDDGDDTLVGGKGNDYLDGKTGNNSLSGGAGNDTLRGGVKNLDGGWRTAADTLNGGDGIDLAYVYASLGPAVSFSVSDALNGPVTLPDGAVLRNIERVHFEGSAYADSLVGGALDDVLVGLNQDDTLVGGGGNDSLDGSWDNDSLKGGDGNDDLIGGDGRNSLAGGAGDDTLRGTFFIVRDPYNPHSSRTIKSTDTLDGGSGIDLAYVYGNQGPAITFAVSANLAGPVTLADGSVLRNIERIHFSGSSFADSLTGGAFDDSLSGGSGDDTLAGGAGNDDLAGSDGNDTLSGAGGIDTLLGGSGADVLKGGAGNDRLTGNTGADVFVFDTALSATGNVDTVADFASGSDTLRLDDDVFTVLLGQSTLTEAQFRSGAGLSTAGDADDRIIYNTTTGGLYYDRDGTGVQLAVKFAVLDTRPTLVVADFAVVN